MTTETKILTPEQIDDIWAEYGLDDAGAHDFARAIEQAVLQSPEVQRLREDAERLDWVEKNFDVAMTREDMDYLMKQRGRP